ncbi:MAG TPA: 3-oxoacyl-ACP synthase, partial [Acidimicrobiales bacterium]|nr:3-oxoacyl-ACP synthase [Acidimicrobiales bacterium]
MPGARITGWGKALPEKIVTNDDLSARLDTSDQWITERTGIKQRYVGGTTSQLAIDAGRQALDRAGRQGSDVDMLILATTTPDATVPGTSATVQHALGIAGGAFDLNAACSGFVYSMVVAHGLVLAGATRILLVGSETLSRITDWDDRSMAVLVGDGAGAVVLEATEGEDELLGWDAGADGSLRHLLKCDLGGYLY